MYRDRVGGGGSSKSEIVGGPLDRKRINDALDKHLEKSSPSTSRALSSKDKERLSVPSTSTGKSQLDHRDSRSAAAAAAASLSKNKCSDGLVSFSPLLVLLSNFSSFVLICRPGLFTILG